MLLLLTGLLLLATDLLAALLTVFLSLLLFLLTAAAVRDLAGVCRCPGTTMDRDRPLALTTSLEPGVGPLAFGVYGST